MVAVLPLLRRRRPRRPRREALRLLVVALILSSPHSARAQQVEQDALAVALQRFEAGRAAFDEGRFEEALTLFQASYRLHTSPNSHLYIARCLRALGHFASAYLHFDLAAREAQDRAEVLLERRYKATRDAARAEAAAVEPRVPRLTVIVPKTAPADLVVRRNGINVASDAWNVEVMVDPGSVVVDANGHRVHSFHAAFELREGERRTVEIVLQRVPTATIKVNLRARPDGIEVRMDGAPIDLRDLDTARDVDVGAHEVVATAPGRETFRWRADLVDRQVVDLEVALAHKPSSGARFSTPPWMLYAVSGGAVAAFGAAAYLGFDARRLSDLQASKDPLLRDAAVRDRVRVEVTAANVLLVVGAVLGTGAGVLVYTTGWSAPGVGPHVAELRASVVAGGAGASLNGQF